jgi:hypothetical protein
LKIRELLAFRRRRKIRLARRRASAYFADRAMKASGKSAADLVSWSTGQVVELASAGVASR